MKRLLYILFALFSCAISANAHISCAEAVAICEATGTYTIIAAADDATTETVYFVNANNWSGTINAYLWNSNGQIASWPGVEATLESFQIGGYDVWSYTTAAGAYANIIFNTTYGYQTADLVWSPGKFYVRNAWYTRAEAFALFGEQDMSASGLYTFEDASLNTQWQFIQSGQTNYWTIGTAAGSCDGGSSALYITNDGTSYSYNANSSSVSWAYIPVSLNPSDTISFNWKGYGENGCDFTYAYLLPHNVYPSAGTTSIPDGAIPLSNSYFQGHDDWQTHTYISEHSGDYNLCFMWRNDGSVAGTPTAIDNVTIKQKAVLPAITYNCGDKLTAELSDSILTISGTGAMYDYSASNPAPWAEYSSVIQQIILADGITSIGNYAFRNFSALLAIALPTSITSVGDYAFQNCTALSQLLIADGLQSIGNYAFHGCSALTSVYAQSPTPPTLGSSAFSSKPACYVPTGTLATYQSSTWSNFATSFTEQDKKCGDNLYWLYNAGVLQIIGSGAMTDWTGYSYVPWYSERTSIHTLVLPAGLTSIGNYAFYYCSALSSIKLPGDLLRIGHYAFQYCSQLADIQLPSTINSIGSNAFYNTKLYNETTNWENDVLYIGNYLIKARNTISGTYTVKANTLLIADNAFSGQTSLTDISMPACVRAIGTEAFYNCSSLTRIRIPAAVESIGESAFYSCDNLAFVELPEGLLTIGNQAFRYCYALPYIGIPSTVTSIGTYAFYTERPETFKAVYMMATTPPTTNGGAFHNTAKCYVPCGAAGAYYASSNWTTYFNNFIELCNLDTYHTFDSSNLNAQWQFIQSGQTNHWVIGVDAGSASISNQALYITHDGYTYAYDTNSESVSWAYIPVSLTATDSISFSWKGVGETCCDYVYAYLIPSGSLPTAGNTTLPEGTITISNKLNQQTAWQHVSVLPNVEGQYNLCFMWTNDQSSGAGAIAIDDVRVGNAPAATNNKCGTNLYWSYADSTLTITGSGDMYEYSKVSLIPWYELRAAIDTVILPEQLTSICRRAFYACSYLKHINIPQSLTHIGSQAFYNCSALSTPINLPEGITALNDSTFFNCYSIPSLTLSEGLTHIGTFACYNCDKLASITVPNSVNTIYYRAFYSCNALKTATLGSGLDSIGNQVFYNTNIENFYLWAQTPPALGENVFYYTYKCYIPSGTLSAYQASAWATNASAFVEQGQCGDNLYYVIENNALLITGYGPMYDYSHQSGLAPWYSQRQNITSISLPEGLTTIGAWAFYDFDGHTTFHLPAAVTSIGIGAFYECSTLTSITIPDQVTTIGYEAFAACSALNQVTLGASLTSIAAYAFSYCPSLTTLYIAAANPPTLGENAFLSTPDVTCYVPCGRLARYQASAWASAVSELQEACYDASFHNFEVPQMNAQWQFIQSGQTNQWTINTAAGSYTTGQNALYISQNGSDYSYNASYASVSWAGIPVSLSTTDTLSFYWKGIGESSCDYLNVYIAPISAQPQAGNNSAPTNALRITNPYLNGQSSWQHFTALPGLSGDFMLWFMWTNDRSVSNTPIAVDDIRIGKPQPATPNYVDNVHICYGDSYTWEVSGTTYDQAGTYTYTIAETQEEYTLHLSISEPAVVDSLAATINAGTSYYWQGSYYDEEGTYTTTERSIHGCDSVIHILTLTIGIYTPQEFTYEVNICYGESYYWNLSGSTYTESGIYTYTASNGDTHTLYLTVSSPAVYDTTSVTIYSTETYEWYGSTYNTAGTYTLTEQSVHGCDSVLHFLELTILEDNRCGANLTWSYSNAVLTIQGTGAMYNYTSSSAVPWYDYRSSITTISLPEGITGVGNYAFYACSALTTVQVAATTPPTLGTNVFNTTPVCYIPCGTLLAYKESAWKNLVANFVVDCGEEGTFTNSYDFENTATNTLWQFIQSGQTNYWTIGTAAGSNNGGSKALYITNDGSSYTYTNSSSSVAWAYIPVTVTAGEDISFSWKGTGEGSYDFIRVYLLPQGYTLPSAGSESISNATTVSSQLSGKSSWQEVSYTPTVSGEYYLIFMWRNDNSAGSNPIAIDNVNAGTVTVSPTNRCGDNLTWSYSNGVLTIQGTGAMYDNHEQLSYRQQSWFPASLTQVNLPNGLTHIGATAFADCHNLTAITIPGTVTSIGQAAFMHAGLRAITLPENVNEIQHMAFAKCDQLTKFTCAGSPSTLANTTAHILLGCTSLDTIIAPASIFACSNADATLEQTYGLPSHATYISVTSGQLSENALYYISLNKNTLRQLILTYVDNTELPTSAFAEYTELQHLYLPTYLTTIPYQMAYNCGSLKSIFFPASVQVIGASAFENCASLREISFAVNSSLTRIGEKAFASCQALSDVTLPQGLSTIETSAFQDCACLVKLHLPSSMSAIYSSAFSYCRQLAKIYVDAYNPPSVYANSFTEVPRTARLLVPESAVNDYKAAAVWNEFIVISNLRDDLEDITVDSQNQVQKLLLDGKVFILKQGKLYNLMGQEINL